jgi:transcriptional regulator with XRE-family HTH domain
MIPSMERLKRWLAESNTSQTALAKSLKVSQPTVSDWINGISSPSVGNLRALGEFTGLSLDELLSVTPSPSSTSQRASA